MFECNSCKEIIEGDKLNYNFQFTIGTMKFGRFVGEKSYYYHLKCLNITDIQK
jgi:hypothetical protein